MRTRIGALALASALVFGAAAGCDDNAVSGPGCDREPAGKVTVFVEGFGETVGLTFTGEVTAIDPPTDIGFRKYRIDEDGTTRVLTYRADGDGLPVAVGERYTFRVDTDPGMPSPNAILLSRDGTLLLAAASDLDLGDRVLPEGVPGFALELADVGCGNRGDDPCFTSRVNLRLDVSAAGDSVSLFHGDTGRVGDYAVTCLVAQRVAYSDACADQGVFGVSYVIRQVED